MRAYIQIVTTTDTRESAERIARFLVEKRLAACVQIDGPVTSLYRWKGRVEEATEWRCVIKSRSGLFEKVAEAVRGMHPYEVPEIVATEFDRVDESYRAWLEDETLPCKEP